jgi:hypothetical protein
MKRFVLYSLVAVLTFIIGVSIELVIHSKYRTARFDHGQMELDLDSPSDLNVTYITEYNHGHDRRQQYFGNHFLTECNQSSFQFKCGRNNALPR